MLKRIRHVLKQNTGMALVLVLCLFALLMGLGASVFFASVTNVKSIDREVASEQAYLSAVSVCDVLKDEIMLLTPDSSTPEFYEQLAALTVGGEGTETPAAGSYVDLEGDIPGYKGSLGTIGTMEGRFVREGEGHGVLTVTVTVGEGRPESYTLQMVFTRLEYTQEADGVDKVEWEFSGYRPIP